MVARGYIDASGEVASDRNVADAILATRGVTTANYRRLIRPADTKGVLVMWKPKHCALTLAGLVGLISPGPTAAQQTRMETVAGMLAAQIRIQGFACDDALKARKDPKRSRPDLGVWVLQCRNAIYRISRAPDMSAKVEQLR